MQEQPSNQTGAPERRRRKPRSKWDIFKEAYLPLVIGALAVLMIVVFITGSLRRSAAKSKAEREASEQSSLAAESIAQEERDEVKQRLADAAVLAEGYDYDGALAVLDDFTGDASKYPELTAKRAEYAQAQTEVTAWSDLGAVPNLSFQLLIADPDRAFANADYGDAYQRNFVTVSEFGKILDQLYANGYVLVNVEDFVSTVQKEDGTTGFEPKTLYLPNGKKPLILTETNVNYYTYMVDGDGDGKADGDGAGFASKLAVDGAGNLTNELVNADGSTVTGAYDLVPVLEQFLAEHPDFSTRGAKATVAVSGYDGLFGYRTNASAKESLGDTAYQAEVQGAADVAEALRAAGYQIACYTYGNISYDEADLSSVQGDLKQWQDEVTPILGETGKLVYAMNSDIATTDETYSGDKYNALRAAGFRYFFGSGTAWASITADYVRQNRILVTGSGLTENPSQYSALFDAAAVVDPARSTQ